MINTKYLKLLDKQETLSLYIHIPFCNTKCYYCAFYSEDKTCWNNDKIENYLDKLLKEISIVKSYYKQSFDTVFIGGGNPGVLGYNNLRKLLIQIGPSKETTFEINPESLNQEYINLFTEGLATRVSVGIQSFNDNILQLLGRNARYADNIKAIKIIRQLDTLKIKAAENYYIKNNIISKETFKDFNTQIKYSFDLMTSLPTQTYEDSIKDIQILMEYTNLSHLSLYCLTVEEGTYLYSLVKDKKIIKNNDLFEKNLLEKLWTYLNKEGFEHYEVSNFSKGDNKCLHNLKYWDLSSYIGLGSTAASTLYNNEKLIRLTNTSNIQSYNEDELLDDYKIEELNINEHLEEYLIVSLRNKRGIKYKYLNKYFNLNREILIKAFNTLDSDSYEIEKDGITISEKGFILLDSLILDISIYLDKYLK